MIKSIFSLMKIPAILSFVLLFSLSSCNYSEKQQDIIQKISKKDTSRFDESFRKNLLNEFSKTDIIRLSSHENAEVALYFFQILLEKYPEECFDVLMKNLDNKKTSIISTSYDTLNAMTVPEAMLFWESRKNIFTKEQKKELFEAILTDIEHKTHLDGYVFMYMLDHEKNPDPKYYSSVRKMITTGADHYMGDYTLLNYFSNYNKPEDSLIIKDFLKKNIFDKGSIHMNLTVEYIGKHPKPSYFPILREFYDERIKGNTFRADDIFFEFEDLTKATIWYKTEDAKNLMKDIAYRTKYTSSGNYLASNEQIYFLLKKYDNANYFKEVTDDLGRKTDPVKLDSIEAWHKRWDRHME